LLSPGRVACGVCSLVGRRQKQLASMVGYTCGKASTAWRDHGIDGKLCLLHIRIVQRRPPRTQHEHRLPSWSSTVSGTR
ncbi:unnamed protein product, partial [Ectocarpus sp. 12 AP-2014]